MKQVLFVGLKNTGQLDLSCVRQVGVQYRHVEEVQPEDDMYPLVEATMVDKELCEQLSAFAEVFFVAGVLTGKQPREVSSEMH